MSILREKRFGLVLRVFAKTPEQVELNAEQVLAAYQEAAGLWVRGRPFFNSVLILVARDKDYLDCDCGETAAYLRKKLPPKAASDVLEVRHGDLFCGVLNYGIARLLRDRIDYVAIVSHGALDYLRSEIIEKMVDAHEKGAAVTGVAIDELSQSIREGRIANTFAMWDAVKLMTVGGFDYRAAQPKKDSQIPHVECWNADKGQLSYPKAGVEEIIPLIRLGRTFGPCIAPIVPRESAEWKAPDPEKDPEGHTRHISKMGTKHERQAWHAMSEGADISVLKGFVMPEYRTF
ncbi:MAG TPA: hypothetical protein VJB97_04470 [Candidatus Paceibacterota bacterium]